MATYNELANIREEAGWGAFQEVVTTACAVKATALLDLPTPTAAQVDWALAALERPAETAKTIATYVIAANKDASLAAILGATDVLVQTNVDAAVDKIVSV